MSARYRSTAASRSARERPWTSRLQATLPATVRQGTSATSWNIIPRSGPGPITSRPWTRIRPASALMNPPRMCSRVLFPQPLGPTIVTNSPSRTSSRARSSTGSTRPSLAKPFCSPTASRATAAISDRGGQEALEPFLDPPRVAALALEPPITQPAGQPPRPLAGLADLAGKPHHGLHARAPPRLVTSQPLRQGLAARGHALQLFSQHRGVLHRHARPLSHVGGERVRGVAEEADTALHPRVLVHLLDVGAEDRFDGGEAAQGPDHAEVGELGEERAQLGDAAEPEAVALRRRVEGRPDIEPLRRDGHQADPLPSPEELGEELDPVAIVHHEAVGAVAQVARLGRPVDRCTHDRVDPVGADQQIGVDPLPA